MPRGRVTEVFAALSLTTDLATGLPFEKGLATCALATAFGSALGLDDADRSAIFCTALLRSIGCTSPASENAALFGDDTAFEASFSRLDPGDPAVLETQLAGFGRWEPERQAGLSRPVGPGAPGRGARGGAARGVRRPRPGRGPGGAPRRLRGEPGPGQPARAARRRGGRPRRRLRAV